MNDYRFTKIRQQFDNTALANIEQTVAEQVGAKLRAMMPWIAKNKLVDAA